MYNTK